MADLTARRRLSVVMFADLVGYSRLMAEDESQAMEVLKFLERLFRSQAEEWGGRLIKSYGDGALLEFPTAGSAVGCALRLIESMSGAGSHSPAALRIGLHLGELIEEGGDVFGDAVNIAARVQALASPGGIAMTGTVHSQIKNRVVLRGHRLPPVKLKNIEERMSVFLVDSAGGSVLQRWRWRMGARLWAWSRVVAAGLGVLALGAGVWVARGIASPPRRNQREEVLEGGRLYRELRCAHCHSIGGRGGGVGPALDVVVPEEPEEWLRKHFREPSRMTPGSIMPAFDLYDAEITSLISFLRALPPAAAGGSNSHP